MNISWKKIALAGFSSALLGFLGCGGCPRPQLGPVLYVRAGATGLDIGTSWADAFTDLQDALAVAAGDLSVTEIWVAADTYRPAGPNGDRAVAFGLLKSLALYGGFAGTETSRNQRDPAANVTILSGDLNGDDQGFVNNGENSYSVVGADGKDLTAVLDGFVIRGGNANQGNRVNGGGLYNQNASPTIVNCTFESNTALVYGGGVFNYNSSPTFRDCTFAGNTTLGSGGGTLNFNSNPTLVDCTFTNNSANSGGAMSNRDNSSPRLTDCTFTDNSATDSGGAVVNNGGAPVFANCQFVSNNAGMGGAVNTFNAAAPTFANCSFVGNAAQLDGAAMLNSIDVLGGLVGCMFRDNSAGRSGGGVANNSGSNLTVVNCTFLGNSASSGGGGLFNFASRPTLMNCIFSGNSGQLGGAVLNRDHADATITNGTFSGNVATFGGGVYNALDSSPVLTNCILWSNTDSGLSLVDAQIRTDSGTPEVTYSCVQGGWAGAGGTGNIATDPLFVDADGADGTAGTTDDDLALQAGSPAIDAGDNDAVPADTLDVDGDGNLTEPTPTDRAANPRFADDGAVADTGNGTAPIVDMGALERQP
ncbi:MAG: right-handed parallel beta-helix repeat-containing protein [Planctomycetes bacterium]|nr:right-handed parallel beta-helix repeat-containing protein [Planctomycetota bacterium]